jgi:hypothetical protein
MRLAVLAPIVAPGRVFAATTAARDVLVIDSRRFSGWEGWWANIYNESHMGFALLTVAVVAGLGLAMGKLTDLVMARTGINLKSRVLAEH